jgi:transcriptional regulator with XRE-family HTH domain
MTNKPGATEPTPSDVVGDRVRGIRRHRRQSVEELAKACADAGHPELTRDAIYAIESGRRLEGRRRRTVSVDELLAFAEVLDVPVGALLYPVLHLPTEEQAEQVEQEPTLEHRTAAEMVDHLLVQLYGPVRKKEE